MTSNEHDIELNVTDTEIEVNTGTENHDNTSEADIVLEEIELTSDTEKQNGQCSLGDCDQALLPPSNSQDDEIVPSIATDEKVSRIFTSEIAIDQTWGEWLHELPGSTWNKVCLFWTCQWRWSKRMAHYTHLPEWMKDNKFLLSHHRLPIYSFAGCFLSAFRLHTETGNIWTHLIGSLLTIAFAIYCFTTRLHKLNWVEQTVYAVFFLAAALCMGFSCMFHTVLNHSPKMFKLFSRLDYSGISLLVVGSYVPWLYYAYFCEPITYIVYTTVVCVIGLVGGIVSLWDKFDKPKYRTFRAAVFLTMGLSAVIPGFHYCIRFGWNTAIHRASLGWMILMGCLYVTGTLMYMLQVPERFFPGKFDIWFQSHQIFHVFVLVAVFVHYHGVSLLEFGHTADRLNNSLCTNNILNITWSKP